MGRIIRLIPRHWALRPKRRINAILTKQDLRRALDLSQGPSSDFDLNSGAGAALAPERSAAVLIAICNVGGQQSIFLTKRAAHLNAHPGQISFPGGKQDATDPSLIHTALREANEEVGLPHSRVEIVGSMPPHSTVTRFDVSPIVGWVDHDWDVLIDPAEVAEGFHAPVSHVLNPANYRVEGRHWMGQRRNYYAVPYGPYYIWGATARMLYALSQRVAAL